MKNQKSFFLFKCALLICVTLISGCDKKEVTSTEETEVIAMENEEYSEVGEPEPYEGEENTTNESLSEADDTGNTDDVASEAVDGVSKLTLNGTRLVNEAGNVVQLRGVSTHGITVYPQFVNYEAFRTLRDDWGANCVRLAMYTMENNGYISGNNNKDYLKRLIDEGVTYATELDMYVIIDWHILSDGNPRTHENEAIDFFREMSEKYKDRPNVIYEICNEPNNTDWQEVKNYALDVIPAIKSNNQDAVIIVGTPDWCQTPDVGLNNPIEGFSNIMYALHFYSASHGSMYRQRMINALNNGVPVFCSEFGTCSADGNGEYDFDEAEAWLEVMDEYDVSYCIWNLSNKAEASALIEHSSKNVNNWPVEELTPEGEWYRNVLRKAGNVTGIGIKDLSQESANCISSN